MGLHLPIDLVRAGLLRAARVERGLQPLLDEASPHPFDGWTADLDRVTDHRVRKPLIGFQQDARVDQPPGGSLPLGDERLQIQALGFGKSHDVFLNHISRIHLLTRSINARLTEH